MSKQRIELRRPVAASTIIAPTAKGLLAGVRAAAQQVADTVGEPIISVDPMTGMPLAVAVPEKSVHDRKARHGQNFAPGAGMDENRFNAIFGDGTEIGRFGVKNKRQLLN